MAHALAMRATSLATSAGLMVLAVLAAFSVTYTVQRWPPADPPIEISVVPEPPPPEPVRSRPHTPPPRDAQAAPVEAPQPESIASTPVETTGAITPHPYETVTIHDPRWLQRPRDLAHYYPRRALARGTQGVVVLDCLVAVSGRLACAVVSETPRNWGFGDAALRIAADHRMAPATRNGAPVEGRYRMRVPFELN
jgi:periplasmic protein TonB